MPCTVRQVVDTHFSGVHALLSAVSRTARVEGCTLYVWSQLLRSWMNNRSSPCSCASAHLRASVRLQITGLPALFTHRVSISHSFTTYGTGAVLAADSSRSSLRLEHLGSSPGKSAYQTGARKTFQTVRTLKSRTGRSDASLASAPSEPGPLASVRLRTMKRMSMAWRTTRTLSWMTMIASRPLSSPHP